MNKNFKRKRRYDGFMNGDNILIKAWSITVEYKFRFLNNMEEIKKLWNTSAIVKRLEIVNNQINTWLPIQYHNFDFIEQMFDELPEPVRLWLVKYYFKN